MEIVLPFLVGTLVGCAVYLMLNRSLVKFLFGLILLSSAANLMIFAGGRLTFAAPPLIPLGESVPPGVISNALPQALILTAIVIGFGLLAFAMVLAYRAYQELGTVDTDAMRVAEPPYEGERVPESMESVAAAEAGESGSPGTNNQDGPTTKGRET